MRVPKPLTTEQSRLIEQAETLMRSRIRADSTQLSDPSAAGNMFRYRLANHEREVFSVAFLDTRHKVIAVEDLFAGTLDGAEVHPREIAKRALTLGAAAIICAHNHPSNNNEPSGADRAVTARLKQSLALVDVRLLDHFVVTADSYTSMAARGWV
ncbi:JAB domain-containing protein [Thauera sp. Sel9]|uniref:JAB domain-containing protein n=1 Tax=Thauera sp. Sel9 TaxID=2974299 RepID=UPI0021E1472E|nr:JAB domain-containing protein [Thauera sp. Sel9]MCV2216118.1 DNA repair protein RadC [Thauera sp. Sel9]